MEAPPKSNGERDILRSAWRSITASRASRSARPGPAIQRAIASKGCKRGM